MNSLRRGIYYHGIKQSAWHMVDIQRVLNKRINILGIYTDVIFIIAKIAKGNKNQNDCLQKVYNIVREYMDVKIYKYIILTFLYNASFNLLICCLEFLHLLS